VTCKIDFENDYKKLYKKREKALEELSDKAKEIFKNDKDFANIRIDFTEDAVKEVVEEIGKLRSKFKDAESFQREAKKLLNELSLEKMKKRIDAYNKKLYDMSLEKDLFQGQSASQALKNLEGLMHVRFDSLSNSYKSKYLNMIEQTFDKEMLNIMTDKTETGVKKFTKILQSIEDPSIKLDEIDAKLAKGIKDIFEFEQRMMLEAGLDRGRIEGYIGSHKLPDMNVIGKPGETPDADSPTFKKAVDDYTESLSDDIFPELDMRLEDDRKLKRKKVRDMLKRHYDNPLDIAPSTEKQDVELRSSMEARFSRSRKLKFKPGKEAEIRMKYNPTSILEELQKRAGTLSKIAAFRETMGPNPISTFTTLTDKLIEKAQKEGDAKVYQKLGGIVEKVGIEGKKFKKETKLGGFESGRKKAYISNVWSNYDGSKDRLGANGKIFRAETVANAAGNMRAWIYMSKLGKTTISALVDLGTTASMLDAATGQGFLKSALDVTVAGLGMAPKAFATYAKALATGQSVDEAFRLRAAELGVFFEHANGGYLKAMGIDGMGTKGIMKMQEVYERLNPIGKQTAFHDYLAMSLYQNAFAKMLKKGNEEILITMGRAGMNADYVPLLKSAIGDVEGTSATAIVFSPQKVFMMDDADLKAHKVKIGSKDPRVAMMSLEEFRNDLTSKVTTMFEDFRNTAVPKPTGKQKGAVAGTKGEIAGELYRSLTMLKSFSLRMIDIQARILGSSNDGWTKARRMSAYMMQMTMMGYAVMTLKDLASNRTPRPVDDPQTWTDSFVQGGAGGIYADMIFSAADTGYNNFAKSMAGPSLGPIEDTIKLAQKAAYTVFGDKRTARKKGLSAKDWKTVGRNMPGNNIFWIRAGLDWALYDSFVKMDRKGHRRRMRTLRERGQSQLYNKSLQGLR
jgi:hypothetical protein